MLQRTNRVPRCSVVCTKALAVSFLPPSRLVGIPSSSLDTRNTNHQAAGAFFTTYEATKSGLHKLNSHFSTTATTPVLPKPVIHSAASVVGELVSCLILTPAEVIKQNAQVLKTPSRSGSTQTFDLQATREAFKKFDRPSQLWRGYTVLAARNLPFTAMQFPMFEHFRQEILEYRKRNGSFSGSIWERGLVTAVSAGSAGSIAAVVTTPIDVVKTRVMLSAASSAEPKQTELERAALASRRSNKSNWRIAQDIVQTDGARGLFRGAVLRGVWTAVGSGLYLSIYESGRTYLEQRREQHNDMLD